MPGVLRRSASTWPRAGMAPHHPLLARNHCTVRRMPVSKIWHGDRPGSRWIFAASMAWRASWPGRSAPTPGGRRPWPALASENVRYSRRKPQFESYIWSRRRVTAIRARARNGQGAGSKDDEDQWHKDASAPPVQGDDGQQPRSAHRPEPAGPGVFRGRAGQSPGGRHHLCLDGGGLAVSGDRDLQANAQHSSGISSTGRLWALPWPSGWARNWRRMHFAWPGSAGGLRRA